MIGSQLGVVMSKYWFCGSYFSAVTSCICHDSCSSRLCALKGRYQLVSLGNRFCSNHYKLWALAGVEHWTRSSFCISSWCCHGKDISEGELKFQSLPLRLCMAWDQPLFISGLQCLICRLKVLNWIMVANLDTSRGQRETAVKKADRMSCLLCEMVGVGEYST